MSYLDTRDLLDELNELTARADDPDQTDPLDTDENERLNALRDLADELGEQTMRGGDAGPLVPEHLWVEYVEELAEDIGAVDADAGWPTRHIDWEAAADELSQDYSSVTFDGVEYYYRAS